MMAPDLPSFERRMRADLRAHGREAGTTVGLKEIQACSDLKDSISVLVVLLVCKAHRTKDEHPISAEETVAVSQPTFCEAIVSISGLVEDKVTTLTTLQSHNGFTKMDSWLNAMVQGLLRNAIDKNLNYVGLRSRLIRKIEQVMTSSHTWRKWRGPWWAISFSFHKWQKLSTKMPRRAWTLSRRAKINTIYLSMFLILKTYGTYRQLDDAWIAIFSGRTHKKSYFKMSEEHGPELPIWNELKTCSKSSL